ncbi:MAG: secondary thiamine-phosphate synthase enzyme YjbQ [Candidatus Omnitrophota bacterium]
MSGKSLSSITVKTTAVNHIVDITAQVADLVRAGAVKDGICTVYVPHTTAAVTINENADPDVKSDLLLGLDRIVPDRLNYRHVEGNSPAHIKASMTGSSITVIIDNGRLLLGTWQGIYFCEFDGPRTRTVYIKRVSG